MKTLRHTLAAALTTATLFTTYANAGDINDKEYMQSVVRGKAHYQQHCASCHGVKGDGDTSLGRMMGDIGNFGDPAYLETPEEEIRRIINNGEGAMPGYSGTFSEDQLQDLINYIRFLPKLSQARSRVEALQKRDVVQEARNTNTRS